MRRYLENEKHISFKDINGYFVIRECVGRGASCVVYRADFYNEFGRVSEHLLKEYNPKDVDLVRNDEECLLVNNESELDRFKQGLENFVDGYKKQELLRRSAELKNYTANVQNLYEGYGTIFIDMNVTEGISYATVKEKTLHNLAKRMKVLAQVVGGYHRNGYLHLDLKPNNIYVRPENETCEDVLLFDFDSLIRKEDVGRGAKVSYTDDWAPLELTSSSRRGLICEATDIFSLGEIFFEKLMGRHSVIRERRSFSKYEYDFESDILKNVNPKVTVLLDELFRNTLCNTVRERYQSVEELCAILDKIIEVCNITEHYKGETYDYIVEKDLDDVLTTALAVAKEIRKYHKEEQLYLELSPSNVLILPESREHVFLFKMKREIKLGEFSLYSDLNRDMIDGYLPLLIKNNESQRVGYQTDIFCLGVMVFEKIFNRLPMEKEMNFDYQYDFNDTQYIELNAYSSVVISLMEKLFHRTIVKNDNYRWSIMEDVIEVLEELLNITKESLFLKKKLIECSNINIGLDIEEVRKRIEDVKCMSLTEYENSMNQKIKSSIIECFDKDEILIKKFIDEYKSIFENLKRSICQEVINQHIEDKVIEVVNAYKESMFEKIENTIDFEGIALINVNVQYEEPRKGEILKLSQPETFMTKLFGPKMETYYYISLECLLRLVNQIEKIAKYNEERVRKQYLVLVKVMFERLSAVLKDSLKNNKNNKSNKSNKSNYAMAIDMLYNSNENLYDEGMKLLFIDYCEYDSKESLEEINKQLPIQDGEILDYIDFKILFMRRRNDYEDGSQLLFGYKTLDGAEHIILSLWMEGAYAKLKTVKGYDRIYILIEDYFQLKLYFFNSKDNEIYFIESKEIESIYGELTLEYSSEKMIKYGKVSHFSKEDKVIFEVDILP